MKLQLVVWGVPGRMRTHRPIKNLNLRTAHENQRNSTHTKARRFDDQRWKFDSLSRRIFVLCLQIGGSASTAWVESALSFFYGGFWVARVLSFVGKRTVLLEPYCETACGFEEALGHFRSEALLVVVSQWWSECTWVNIPTGNDSKKALCVLLSDECRRRVKSSYGMCVNGDWDSAE